MQFQPRSPRFVALFTGLVLASASLGIAPAHAMDKSKKLKYGAIAAGVVGAYLLAKGKTVPAAVVGGAGYYAYKKSGEARDEERYNDRYGYNRDGDRYGYNSGGDVYPDDYNPQYRSNATARQPKSRRNLDLSPYRR